MREKALYRPGQRGRLTGDRLLGVFKLLNTLAGYEGRFAESTKRRLGYWRGALRQGGAQFPPLGDETLEAPVNPRFRRIRVLLTLLLKAERMEDSNYISHRILFVNISPFLYRLSKLLIHS